MNIQEEIEALEQLREEAINSKNKNPLLCQFEHRANVGDLSEIDFRLYVLHSQLNEQGDNDE